LDEYFVDTPEDVPALMDTLALPVDFSS
jgi:hypothetical protein